MACAQLGRVPSALRRILPHHRSSFERVERGRFITIWPPAGKANSTVVSASEDAMGHYGIPDNLSHRIPDFRTGHPLYSSPCPVILAWLLLELYFVDRAS